MLAPTDRAAIMQELASRGVAIPEHMRMQQAYEQARGTAQGKADVGKITKAVEGVQNADSMLSASQEARTLLDSGTPTGFGADARIAAGRAVPFLSMIPGIPNKDQTTNLERFRQVSNELALGEVGKLKGPLSDRDILFLQRMNVGADTSPGGNRRAIAAREWVAKRQKAYEAALQTWTAKGGAPSALSPRGQSFDAWFSGWANDRLPPPWSHREAGNTALQARSQAGGRGESITVDINGRPVR